MESFSKFISIIILCIGLFFIPMMYVTAQEDAISQNYVSERTTAFVEEVKKQGKITQKMYSDFMSDLGKTNIVYDVEMVHKRTETAPKFDSAGNVESVTEYYVCYYTDEIKDCIFGKTTRDGSLTDEEVKAGWVEGEYHLNKGDYFTVEVKNKQLTSGTRIRNMVFGTSGGDSVIFVTYGGTIQDENY